MSGAPRIVPYGEWSSPIDAALIATAAKPLSGAAFDDRDVYWLEGVADEGGRMTVVSARTGTSLIPAPYDVRTRVHEYGGGAWLVDRGTIWFSHFRDHRVHRRSPDGTIAPITADGAVRYADFVLDRARGRLICVAEDHSAEGEPRASLVALAADGAAPPRTLVDGHDFYAAPRLSPDGCTLAWIAWRHPQMPWDGTELWTASIADDGGLRDARRVAGGPDESLVQPTWSPDGVLHVVSDRSGWWNVCRVVGDALVDVHPVDADFAKPAWQFGHARYAFVDARTIVAVAIADGVSSLLRVALGDDGVATRADRIDTPFTVFDELAVHDSAACVVATSPTSLARLVRIDLDSGRAETLATSSDVAIDPRFLSTPRRLRFSGRDGRVVHAIYYPPQNPDFAGPPDARPPMIVQGHGGPTTMTNDGLRLGNQFWTTRGFAILDVDYAGSSGYGRAYRRALAGAWGTADVEDCVDGASYAVAAGLADPDRLVVRGGSASGYIALAAVTFHARFGAAVVYYGVSDIARLMDETHKFESRYGDFLIGSDDAARARMAARSPLLHVDRVRVPVLFFQGLEDRVVPPSQSEAMADSLRRRGVPCAYVAFEHEGHGFRRLETLRRTPTIELSFYAQVFGLVPADPVEPVLVDGSDA